jgi:hypothetical protein
MISKISVPVLCFLLSVVQKLKGHQMMLTKIDLDHTEGGLTWEQCCQKMWEMVLIKNATQPVVSVSSKVQ